MIQIQSYTLHIACLLTQANITSKNFNIISVAEQINFKTIEIPMLKLKLEPDRLNFTISFETGLILILWIQLINNFGK